MSKTNNLPKILGLDVGKKRIGSALSDSLRITAAPFINFPINGSLDQVIKEILLKCEVNNVDTIVIGLPLELDGSVGDQASFTLKFVLRLAKKIDPNTNITIESLSLNKLIQTKTYFIFIIDERFTSIQAEKEIIAPKLKNSARREVKDNVTACILVDTFLQMSSLSKI